MHPFDLETFQGRIREPRAVAQLKGRWSGWYFPSSPVPSRRAFPHLINYEETISRKCLPPNTIQLEQPPNTFIANMDKSWFRLQGTLRYAHKQHSIAQSCEIIFPKLFRWTVDFFFKLFRRSICASRPGLRKIQLDSFRPQASDIFLRIQNRLCYVYPCMDLP